MFLPRHLAVFYPYHAGKLNAWQIFAALLLLIITIYVIRSAARYRYLPVGWFWYIGTLVPVIGLVQVGEQAIADRYTYVTLIGLFIIIAWGTNDLLKEWQYRKIALSVSSFAVVFVLSVCAWFQTGYWQNSLTLFRHAVKATTGNYVIYNNLGALMLEQGKFDEAVDLFHHAAKVAPTDSGALFNLGITCIQLGRYQDAAEAFRSAVKVKPDYADACYHLGVACGRIGQHREEIEAYSRAIKIKPDYANAYGNLGHALVRQNKFKQAIPYLQKAVSLEPNSPIANSSLAVALFHEGRIEEAPLYFNKALRVTPEQVALMNNLAWIGATRKKAPFYNPQQAVKLAVRACELSSYADAGILDTLSVTYAAVNKFSDAVAAAEKALKIAQSAQDKKLAEQIQQRLDLYRKNQPYVETDSK